MTAGTTEFERAGPQFGARCTVIAAAGLCGRLGAGLAATPSLAARGSSGRVPAPGGPGTAEPRLARYAVRRPLADSLHAANCLG